MWDKTLTLIDVPLVMDKEPAGFITDLAPLFRDNMAQPDESIVDVPVPVPATVSPPVDEIINIEVPLVLEPDKWPECCIYRVPQLLRRVNNLAYTPKLISIGPFHHDKGNLRKMEKLKERYFKGACYRTKKTIKDLTRIIQEKKFDILHCYADPGINADDHFVKMILFDSIFILEHLWMTKQNPPMSHGSNSRTSSSVYKCECRMLDSSLMMTCQKGSEEGEGEKENPWQSYNLLQDLILLENQVPFFILEELYNFAYRDLNNSCCCQSQNHNGDGDNSFVKLVIDFFLHFWKETGLICSSDYKEKLPDEVKKIRHFTDFLRYFLLPKEQKCGQSIKRVPCATKLAEAGVEFRGGNNINRRLLDIEFRKSWLLKKCPFLNLSWLLSCFQCFECLEEMQPILELQSFKVWDATECIIRNLMAFEQCHYPGKLTYATISSGKSDQRNQIVEANHSCYYDLSKKIHSHYSSRWSRLMASLTNLYFRDFWRGTTTVVAILVLLLTFGSFITPFVFQR
uniref:Uncharacterized protein n=1 Tax=Fagus sylvatica TaxID=28930 RepID=A0A2N9GC26_FAGSY